MPSSRGSSQPRDGTTSLALQADSSPLCHLGSPIFSGPSGPPDRTREVGYESFHKGPGAPEG